MSSNVDDVLYSYLPKGAEVVNSVSTSAILGRQGRLWHFKEFRQEENFGIYVSTKDNTERVQPVAYDAKQGSTRKPTEAEKHQLRSFTQSLAWIVRQTRLDLCYRLWRIQSIYEEGAHTTAQKRTAGDSAIRTLPDWTSNAAGEHRGHKRFERRCLKRRKEELVVSGGVLDLEEDVQELFCYRKEETAAVRTWITDVRYTALKGMAEVRTDGRLWDEDMPQCMRKSIWQISDQVLEDVKAGYVHTHNIMWKSLGFLSISCEKEKEEEPSRSRVLVCIVSCSQWTTLWWVSTNHGERSKT